MTSDEARKHTAVRLALATLLKDEFEVDNLFVGDFAALDTPLSLGIERKCAAPNTPLLRDDLTWVLAGDVRVGDRVLAIEEEVRTSRRVRRGMGGKRGWFWTTVTHSEIAVRRNVRVILDDGSELVCTPEHPWLVYPAKHSEHLVWRRAETLDPGVRVPRYLRPWAAEDSADSGYLGAAFDGEGCLSFCHSRPVWALQFAQADNPMLARVRHILAARGVVTRESIRQPKYPGSQPNMTLHTKGGSPVVMELLGSTRAERLIGRLIEKWTSPLYLRPCSRPRVVEVRPMPDMPTAVISTAAGTYMADGFAAHNSFPNLVQSLASNELDEQLAKMVAVYDIPVLLIEGLPVPVAGKVRVYGAQRSYTYAWIIGSIVGWYLRGVMPVFVKDLKATPPTVAALYGTAKKLEHRDTFAPKKILPNLRPMSLTERVLLQFPGVGEKRVKQFRGESLAALASLPVEDWQERLGKVTGRKVAELWLK